MTPPPNHTDMNPRSGHQANQDLSHHSGYGHAGTSTFLAWPILGPLLFQNESSDARDHCANERSDSRLQPLFIVLLLAMLLGLGFISQPSVTQTNAAS